MADPKTLADKPIADRRGDNVLDRHVHHVIDHPDQQDEPAKDEEAAEPVENEEQAEDEDQGEDFLGF